MYKSIFHKLSDYKTDPIKEFNKINRLIHDRIFYETYDLYGLFCDYFEECKLLRPYYASFDDCIQSYAGHLEQYKELMFERLEEEIQSELLDEYLNFCEVVLHMIFVVLNSITQNMDSSEWCDADLPNHVIDIIRTGLKSMNYQLDIIGEDEPEIRISKIDEEAEIVATQSCDSIKEVIRLYLGARDSDLESKEMYLHKFVDLLEPIFKKYDNKPVSSIREYVQLVRHPETKKNEPKYVWFYESKAQYLDDLFSMCLLVQHYDLVNTKLEEFKTNKSRT